jgi:glycosyltransferase involved in cell wall biosynthesis
MTTIRLSIIIPTYNRPELLPRAVKSALAQTIEDFEVIVVDDASPQPVNLPEHPRLRCIRLPENKGGSAARNIGAKAAKGRWLTYLDDDDRLLPHMAQVSLKALENTTLPQPVAALSGLEVINEKGQVKQTRIPPTLPKGSHFCLEEIQPDKSFLCKQTMVVEKEVLLSIGGFDESFTSRVHTELFLRLNQVCSLLGISQVTYQLLDHKNARVSADSSRRQVNFERLLSKHQSLFEAHPKMFANFIYDHAIMSYNSEQKLEAIKSIGKAMRIHPVHTLARMGSPFKKGLLSLIYNSQNIEEVN